MGKDKNKKTINVYVARADKQDDKQLFEELEKLEDELGEYNLKTQRKINRNTFFKFVVFDYFGIDNSTEIENVKELRVKMLEKLNEEGFILNFEKKVKKYSTSKKQAISSLVEQQNEAFKGKNYELAEELMLKIQQLNDGEKMKIGVTE